MHHQILLRRIQMMQKQKKNKNQRKDSLLPTTATFPALNDNNLSSRLFHPYMRVSICLLISANLIKWSSIHFTHSQQPAHMNSVEYCRQSSTTNLQQKKHAFLFIRLWREYGMLGIHPYGRVSFQLSTTWGANGVYILLWRPFGSLNDSFCNEKNKCNQWMC